MKKISYVLQYSSIIKNLPVVMSLCFDAKKNQTFSCTSTFTEGGGVFHYKGIFRCEAGMGYSFHASKYMNGVSFSLKKYMNR